MPPAKGFLYFLAVVLPPLKHVGDVVIGLWVGLTGMVLRLSVSFAVLVTLAVLAGSLSGSEQFIVNSDDWKVIYVSALNAHFHGASNHFFVSVLQAPSVEKRLNRNENTTIVETIKPIASNYRQTLMEAGYTVKDVITVENGDEFALEVARRAAAKKVCRR